MDLTLLLGWDPNEAIGEVADTAFATRRPGTHSQRSSGEGYPAPGRDTSSRTMTQGHGPAAARRNTPPPAEERRPALSPRVDQMPDSAFTQNVPSKSRVPTVRGIGIANALLMSVSSMPRGGNDVMVLLQKLQRVREAMSEGLEVSASLQSIQVVESM